MKKACTILLLCLAAAPYVLARHQDQTEEPESIAWIVFEAAGNIIVSSIEENRRSRDMEQIMQAWCVQQGSKDVVAVQLYHHDLSAQLPIDTCGQVLLKIEHSKSDPEWIFMVMQDEWYARGNIQFDRINHFSINAEDYRQFMQGYLSYIIGTEVRNLDSIPVYETMRMGSKKYKRYLKEIDRGEYTILQDQCPRLLSANEHNVRAFKKWVKLAEIDGITRRKLYGKIYQNGTFTEWQMDIFPASRRSLVKTCEVGDLQAIFTSKQCQIGAASLGYFYLSPALIWDLCNEFQLREVAK